MKALIVEDEPLAIKNLSLMIRELRPNWEIAECLDSIETVTSFFANNNQVDLAFFDIHLADGVSFKIFEKAEVNCPIILTTAYDQYALKAFKVNSVDYLLKPLQKLNLEKAILKFENQQTKTGVDFDALLKAFEKKEDFQKRFLVFAGNKIKTIPVEDVAYFFSENKRAFLVKKSGEQFMVDGSLDKIEKGLNPQNFFRINRQFIIGFDAIVEMEPYTKSRIYLKVNPTTEKETIVSVERSSELKKWLNQ